MAKAPFIDSLSLPAVAAPMFLISGPQLVIECCKNGIVGTFPALNQRTTEGFEEWVVQIKEELARFEQETGKKSGSFWGKPHCTPFEPARTSRLDGVYQTQSAVDYHVVGRGVDARGRRA